MDGSMRDLTEKQVKFLLKKNTKYLIMTSVNDVGGMSTRQIAEEVLGGRYQLAHMHLMELEKAGVMKRDEEGRWYGR